MRSAGAGMMGNMMKGNNLPGQGPMGILSGLIEPPGSMRPKAKADPVTDAEDALKKLRENPSDKQATKALEQALKQLKERQKQNISDPTDPVVP